MNSRHAAAFASKYAKAVTLGALLGLLTPVEVLAIMKLYPFDCAGLDGLVVAELDTHTGVRAPAPVADMRLVWTVSIGINVCLYAALFSFALIVFDTWRRL